MKHPQKLIPGTLVKRYKRFLSDIKLADGTVVTAMCPNTGSMKTVSEPGSEVYISPAQNPERKTRYTWELVKPPGRDWVCINTHLANAVAEDAIASGAIGMLRGYKSLRREVKYGKNSRIDILLDEPTGKAKAPCYVEVKNTTLAFDDGVLFPDAVTSRGLKHLHELVNVVAEGGRAVMFYLVHRDDCKYFAPADEIDPEYCSALREVADKGVELLAYSFKVTPKEITPARKLPIRL